MQIPWALESINIPKIFPRTFITWAEILHTGPAASKCSFISAYMASYVAMLTLH